MIGSKLGHYEITAHLGSGGMGEVYQATDSKLGRSVAVKLLPESFAHDAERVARFEREARTLATLNHSNIAAIYGLERTNEHHFLVMELVEGETLAERIARGPIAWEDAIVIARQITEALEAAHEKGIVHRDLKPANVKLTPDEKVKVLDFGLAKGIEAVQDNLVLSDSPTLSLAATNAGVILGTAAYMSPEQARGRTVDRRTDIFAFGCVLYEMLTGTRAFEGEDVADVISAVLKAEPDWTRLPANVPVALRRLLRQCLQKDVRKRRRDAGDVLLDLEQAANESDAASAPTASRVRRGIAWFAVTGALALSMLIFAALYFRPLSKAHEMRVDINTPSSTNPYQIALSPDGESIAFVASGGGVSRLWVRRLDQTDAQPVPGTEDASLPFWSPDSRSIGFFAAAKLKRVDLSGGTPAILADIGAPGGGTWNEDGTILYAPTVVSGLNRVSAAGGPPSPVTKLAPQQTGHRFPYFLPDGRNFLFVALGGSDTTGIYLGSLDGTEPKRLGAADSSAVYLPPGRVVYVRQGRLVAQKLDLSRRELIGDPESVAGSVFYDAFAFSAAFSVSANGRIAYRTGGADLRQLLLFDRTGRPAGTLGDPDAAGLIAPEMSPDGRRVAVDRTIQGNRDIWLWDILRGGWTRFTFDSSIDGFPVWSPDGAQIAFESARNSANGFDIFVKSANSASPEQPLLEAPGSQWPLAWSKDGRFLLYYDQSKGDGDIEALPLAGNDRKPMDVARTPFTERTADFSPDVHWVAYDTNESGRFEIVVQSFPNPSAKYQVSTGGGVQPRWSADGRELYFLAPDGKLMAASVRAGGGVFEAAKATPFLENQVFLAPSGPGGSKQQYSITRDGKILVNHSVESVQTPINLILNWQPK